MRERLRNLRARVWAWLERRVILPATTGLALLWRHRSGAADVVGVALVAMAAGMIYRPAGVAVVGLALLVAARGVPARKDKA